MKKVIPLTPPNDTVSNGAGDLGMNAVLLGVENPTPFYWYLPDELRYIPPFATGVLIPLEGVLQARVLFQAPPGFQQIAPSAGNATGVANFTYYDEDSARGMNPDSGVLLTGASFSQGVPIKTVGPFFGFLTLSDMFPQATKGFMYNVQYVGGNPSVGLFGIGLFLPMPPPQSAVQVVYNTFNAIDSPRVFPVRFPVPAGAIMVLQWAGSTPGILVSLLSL